MARQVGTLHLRLGPRGALELVAADAVGTQTEALVIRGLSVGVPIGQIVLRELLTGLLVGAILASAFLPVGLVLWDRGDVAVAVAIAIMAAMAGTPWMPSQAGCWERQATASSSSCCGAPSLHPTSI